MPLVRVDMWPAASPEQKQELMRKLTDTVVEVIGCPEDAVQVMVVEVDKGNWSTGGVCHADRFPVQPDADG